MAPKTSNPQSYYLVPSLKTLITHKIISWVYEDNLPLPLTSLPQDILDFMTSKMPFCVIYRIYEMKLAGDVIGLDFVRDYADTKQFTDETRSILTKQLKVKQDTKIGLWTVFRRSCLRNPAQTCLFWKEFTKREREVARREIARREEVKEREGEEGIEEGEKKRQRQMIDVWGSKKLEEWKKERGKMIPGSNNRTMMFHEYYDLVVRTAEKYGIDNIPLFLLNKVEDESGLNEKRLRDLETEIKSFILKMKMLTNDFLPIQRQCTTYAPLPIWIRPSPLNKEHKYIRSRTKVILQQIHSNFTPSSSSLTPSPYYYDSSSSSSSSSSTTSSPRHSPPPGVPLILPSSTSPRHSPPPGVPLTFPSSTSHLPSDSLHQPPSPNSVRFFDSVFASIAASTSCVQRAEEAMQDVGARDEHLRNAMAALRELRRNASAGAEAEDKSERERERDDEKEEEKHE